MTDCSFSSIGFDQFAEIVDKNKPAGVRIPICGTLELTPSCNFKCVHCYVTHCQHTESVLSYQEVCRIIDEIVEEGCMFLLLTGGEPLLRKDFIDIYTYTKMKGMFVTVFTNGSLITAETARYFYDMPPRLVEISLYGATPETHDTITGAKGTFEKAINGIKLLLENGIKVNLKTMAMTLNVAEIPMMHELADSLGIPFRYDPILNPQLDGSCRPYEYRLSPEAVLQLDKANEDVIAGWNDYFERLGDPPPMRDSLYVCGVGKGRFHIDAFGKLQLCTIARKPEYDLRIGTFHEGWYDFLLKAANAKLNRPTACHNCDLRGICQICPGWNLMEYGILDAQPVEYLCKLAGLRAEAFDKRKAKAV